jgi:hypothetical protein
LAPLAVQVGFHAEKTRCICPRPVCHEHRGHRNRHAFRSQSAEGDMRALSQGQDLTERRSGRLPDDFIREFEHRGRMSRPRALAVASGDKNVAFRQQFQ